MKKIFSLLIGILSIFSLSLPVYGNNTESNLKKMYDYYAGLSVKECDFGEHMPILKQLAVECPTVCEIGVGNVISTWAIIKGLSENPAEHRSYVGVDIVRPPLEKFQLVRDEADKLGIEFRFRRGNDLLMDIEPVDLLFIDSMHTYCHLTYELEKFSLQAKKYIAMHDTSEPWGDKEDDAYRGDYSEYPSHYDRTKKGLWPAVEDFLERHPEWSLQERRLNCHGFTVLKRN